MVTISSVKVDYKRFEEAAQAVDAFIAKLKKNMDTAYQEVDELGNIWHGADYIQFRSQWARLTNKGSVCNELIESLEEYAEFLRVAGRTYKDIYTEANNMANRLPK